MTAVSLLFVVLAAAPPARPAATVARATVQPIDLNAGRLAMVTGCLASDRANAYQLTNVVAPSMLVTATPAFRLGPRPVGMSADMTESNTAAEYRLDSPFKLKSQLGQRVEVIGTVEAAGNARAATLKVRSVRMLNERCE